MAQTQTINLSDIHGAQAQATNAAQAQVTQPTTISLSDIDETQTQPSTPPQTPSPSTLQNIGSGLEQTAGDIWDTLKGAVSSPANAAKTIIPLGVGSTIDAYHEIKESIPLFHAYETARSNGMNVLDSLKAANDQAAKQNAAKQALMQRM